MEDDLKIEAIFAYDDPKKDVVKGLTQYSIIFQYIVLIFRKNFTLQE